MKSKIEQTIEMRAKRRGLYISVEKFRYANNYIYPVKDTIEKALYVGIGHGQDAIIALLDNKVKKIIGVDPYISEDGNDDIDYKELNELILQCNLSERIEIHRTTVQDYMRSDANNKFDLIIFNDVLHHIFWTEKLLDQSEYYNGAVELFSMISSLLNDDGMVVVADVVRTGIRPLMVTLGLINTAVVYKAKQPSSQWSKAASSSFRLLKRRAYIPYMFRKIRTIIPGTIAIVSGLSDKYFLYFQKQ